MRAFRLCLGAIAGVALGLFQACAPALNWREVPLPAAQVLATFPCKPKIESKGEAGLARCEASGAVFAVAWQPAADPSNARRLLVSSVERFNQHTGAVGERRVAAVLPKGALAWPEAGHFRWQGVQTKVWARGTKVMQATVLGGDDDAAVVFLDGLIGRD
jgi:hypothetical protein